MRNTRLFFLFPMLLLMVFMSGCLRKSSQGNSPGSTVTLSKEKLHDKIRGGWAGQTIGVVYGAPVEFKFQGSLINEYQNIPWNDGYVKYWWDKKPGLFDDVYTDLNFVEAFEKYGLDVSRDTIAAHWARTSYHLAHANQASRYNILNGIMPPASGNWKNNPHADDLDFQIEADFIGLMCPGLVNKSSEIADRTGHIMNSGDGWYGGVFVAALYSLAFISDDPQDIVEQALKNIPQQTTFHQCIADVLSWHQEHPGDWKATWFELQKKWDRDVGCPKGVFLSFNIDAKINSAYVALALLYGQGDFTRSVDIATRCGQDADCNAATVGGVLGVMHGYSGIPEFWSKPLSEIEPLNFEGTSMSLEKAYALSYKHALGILQKAGVDTAAANLAIPVTEPVPVAFEQNFDQCYPISREKIDQSYTGSFSFEFTGNGYILYGNLIKRSKIDTNYIDRVAKKLGTEVFGLAEPEDPYVAELKIYINDRLDETVRLPMKNSARRLEPAWKYQLPEGHYRVRIDWLNPDPGYELRINDRVIYSSVKPTGNIPNTATF
ncbi:MAG TPA: ADP-ribosylglycohydrolase family protein [Bacteroidales bacterium]|nr:ADP-ribosylglycohydrolase family protein [Bacteroidales bacterium]